MILLCQPLGDLSIDCSNDNTSDYNARIYFIEQITGLRQIVNEPTRVTLTTSTLIDVIITNYPDRHVVTGVIPLSLSDHYMPFTVINYPKPCINVHNTISFRDFKRFDVSFKTDLYNIMPRTLEIIKTNNCDANESWLLWKESFGNVCNKHSPLRKVRVKTRFNPWVTPELLKLNV